MYNCIMHDDVYATQNRTLSVLFSAWGIARSLNGSISGEYRDLANTWCWVLGQEILDQVRRTG